MKTKKINNSSINAAVRRLNEYLKSKGVQEINGMTKIQKIRLYCEFEQKETPTKKQSNSFLFNEYKNPLSKISSSIKLANSPKAIKKEKKLYWSNRRKKYEDHINSVEWKNFRQEIIKKRGYKCEKCGAANTVIHAHHLTYERLTNELPEDIQLLCITCHKQAHKRPIKFTKTLAKFF